MRFVLFTVLLLPLAVDSKGIFDSLFGKGSSKDQCPIKLYDVKDPSFTGMKLYANVDTFHPLLRTLSKYAKDCRVKIQIKQGFIQENSGLTTLKINDHSEMAFRLGEGIEFELVDRDNKLLCNRLCLQKDLSKLSALPDAKCFLEKVSKNSDFRQDAIKPNVLIKRPQLNEPLSKLESKRKDIQEKCAKVKIDA